MSSGLWYLVGILAAAFIAVGLHWLALEVRDWWRAVSAPPPRRGGPGGAYRSPASETDDERRARAIWEAERTIAVEKAMFVVYGLGLALWLCF